MSDLLRDEELYRSCIPDYMRWNGKYEDLLLTSDEYLSPGYKTDFRKALIVNSDNKNYKNAIEEEWVYAGGDSGSHLNYFKMIQGEFELVAPATEIIGGFRKEWKNVLSLSGTS